MATITANARDDKPRYVCFVFNYNDFFTDIYVYGHYHHHHGHNERGGTTTMGVWRNNNDSRGTMMNGGGLDDLG